MSISTAVGWSLAGSEARHAKCRIDLASPSRGLSVTSSDRLLGLDLRTPGGDPRPVDSWVRGDDLVAVYEPADPRRLRATALWRPFPGREAAWEVIVSAQTSLIESDSSLAVTAVVPEGDVFLGRVTTGRVAWSPLTAAARATDASCLIIRGEAASTLVAVHPADARRITLRREAGELRIACWLFSSLIEKGVLLRSRVLAARGPSGDPAWADDLVMAFAASPPPLTT